MGSRRENFQESLERNKEAGKRQGGGYETEAEKIVYLPLVQDEVQIFRIMGNSLGDGKKVGTDNTIITRSVIKDDSGGWFTCNWDADGNWFLRRVLKKVGSYKWDQTLNNGKGARIYDNDGCELLKRILTNGVVNPNATGWLPKDWVMMNVIDRLDPWCKENKHTKSLAKSINEDGYPEPGITMGMYKTIWTGPCNDYSQHTEEFDVAIRRFSEKVGEDWHKVFHAGEESKKLIKYEESDKKEYLKYIVSGDVTEEELAYGMYDFSIHPFFQVTSYIKLNNRLGKFMKQIDLKYNTNFAEELEGLSATQKKEMEAKKASEPKTSSSPAKAAPTQTVDDDLPDEEAPPVRTRTAAPTAQKTLEDFKGYAKVVEAERKFMVGVGDDGNIIFNSPNALLPCPNCDKDFPVEMHNCPYCGSKVQ
jgi:hypothetical protein